MEENRAGNGTRGGFPEKLVELELQSLTRPSSFQDQKQVERVGVSHSVFCDVSKGVML